MALIGSNSSSSAGDEGGVREKRRKAKENVHTKVELSSPSSQIPTLLMKFNESLVASPSFANLTTTTTNTTVSTTKYGRVSNADTSPTISARNFSSAQQIFSQASNNSNNINKYHVQRSKKNPKHSQLLKNNVSGGGGDIDNNPSLPISAAEQSQQLQLMIAERARIKALLDDSSASGASSFEFINDNKLLATAVTSMQQTLSADDIMAHGIQFKNFIEPSEFH